MNCAVCSERKDSYTQIPNSASIFICKECRQSMLEIRKTPKPCWDLQSLPDQDNLICSRCLQYTPSYIKIDENPLLLLCYFCAQAVPKRKDSKKLIGIKWKNIIKCTEDLVRYHAFKDNLKKFKMECGDFMGQIDLTKMMMNELKDQLKKELTITFNEHFSLVKKHKVKLSGFLRDVRSEIKDTILKKQRSPYSILLKSNHRQKSFEKEVVLVDIMNEKNSLESFISSFCSLKLLSTTDFIEDPCMAVLSSTGEGWLRSLKFTKFEKKSISPVIAKQKSSWVQYPNKDILYCGGIENKVASGKSYVITNNDTLIELKGFCAKIDHSCYVYEDIVYVFGGDNKIFQKYSRITNEWRKICDTPEVLGYSSACFLNKTMLISGYTRKDLYLYTIEKNSFSKFSAPTLKNNASKLLLVDKILYCVCEDAVHKSNIDGKAWTKLDAILPKGSLNCIIAPVALDGFFYFLNTNLELLRFSTFDYGIIKIEAFK